MKHTHPFSAALSVSIAAGLTGAALRLLLYRIGFDEKGILPSGHPLHLACLALAAGLLLWLALRSRTEDAVSCASSRILGTGFAAGALLLFSAVTQAPQPGALSLLRQFLTGAAALSIPLSLWLIPRMPRAAFGCHCLICICFGVDMLCRYQTWSGNPQLPDYCFHVLACVFLALSSYQRLALGAGIGKQPALRFTCLAALALCLMSTVGPDPWQFYLAGGCWAMVNYLTPSPPEQPKQEEARNDVSA